MYSRLDVRYLDVPETCPEFEADSAKFYQIQDRFFLAFGADSLRRYANPLMVTLIDAKLVEDTGVVSIFETNSDGVPLGWGGDDDEVEDAIAGVDAHDHEAGLDALLKHLNS